MSPTISMNILCTVELHENEYKTSSKIFWLTGRLGGLDT